MAKALTDAGITTFLVTDAAVFAVMSRVTRVVMGTSVGLDLLASPDIHPGPGDSFLALACCACSVIMYSGHANQE